MAGETMSISDLLGLNSPRGLLGSSFGSSSSSLCTPPAATANFQMKNGDNKLLNFASVTSGSMKNNGPLSVGSSTGSAPPNFYQRGILRSTSLSDCSGSNSPAVLDQPLLNTNSRSNSPTESDNSAISGANGSLTEILNSLTLNEAFGCNCLNANDLRDKIDLNNLQNLQALQAFKYLQQPPALLNTLLNPTCSYNTSQLSDRWERNNGLGIVPLQDNLHLDRAARFHRSAAAVCDATCTWSGVLPVRTSKPIGYSSEVFLGGVPWDVSEQMLVQTFKQFGQIRVEWPGKDKQASQPKGYVYIIFESEKNVKALLQECTKEFPNSGNWYYKISSKRMKAKEVQVIPWILNDSNYTKCTSQKLDASKTVFVGALHGMLNAEGLAKIMNDLFEGVIYAGIDTDKYKYPIGSGRVTFNNPRSYMRAVAAAFIEIKTAKFTKKVQIDPYLEDTLCSVCAVQQGPYFCREISCFQYFCRLCWQWQHNGDLRHHKPMMRNSKNSTIMGLGNVTLN